MIDQLLPELIAPDVACDLCVEQMRQLTLMGQSLVSPGVCNSYAPRAIAGALHDHKLHVHCNLEIGDRAYHARADIALPLLPRPTAVMYDAGHRDSKFGSLNFERHAAEKRLHWADDVADSARFERAGWRVIRVRAPRLDAAGPLDLLLPRAIESGSANEQLIDDVVQQVVAVTYADLVAA